MASSISSLNSLLLNPYTQQALNAAQSKQAIDPIKPGASITARYTVEDDGELTLREFNVESVKLLDPKDEGTKQKQQDANAEEAPQRQYSFADIAPARATLSPSDEVSLFAAQAQDGTVTLPEPANNNNATIIEAQYEEIGKTPQPDVKTVAAQQQQKTANLYARNLDIIYNIIPIYSEAA